MSTLLSAATFGTDRAEAAVVRLAASLFLRPTGMLAVCTYWMMHYQPDLLTQTIAGPAVVVRSDDDDEASRMASLLRLVWQGPTGFVLAGRSKFAFTAQSPKPRWLHWFSFFPTMAMSVRVPYLATAGLSDACSALKEVYLENKGVWATSSTDSRAGTLAGEHYFEHCAHVDLLRALFPRRLFCVQLLLLWLQSLARVVPLHRHLADAIPILRRTLAEATALHGDPVMVGIIQCLQQASELGSALDQLNAVRHALVDNVVRIYKNLRDAYGQEESGYWPHEYASDEAPVPVRGMWQTIVEESAVEIM